MRVSSPSVLGRSAASAAVLLLVVACTSGSVVAPGSPTASQAVAMTASPSTAAPSGTALPLSVSSAPAAAATASPKPGTFTISLPVSDLTGTLDMPSKGFDRSKLDGFLPGTIKFDWFRSTGGTMVALIFLGHLPAGVDPLCAGTSLTTTAGLEDLTKSPLGTGGCEGDDKSLATAPAGGQICNGGFLVYTTTIPNDAVGSLSVSLEKTQPDGSISGLTSTTDTGPKLAVYPNQIDLSKYTCEPAG
jgi:hypothetical protein